MSPWSRFPFVRIALALAGGILVARHWEGKGWWAAVGLGLLLLLYCLSVVIAASEALHDWSAWLGLLGLSCVFLLGYLRCCTVQEACYAPDHVSQWADILEAYEAVALEDLHCKPTRSHVVVAVRRARVRGVWKKMQGKVQVSFPRDTTLQVYYGDVLLIRGQPQEVPLPQNPFAFDYAAFLGLSQIYHQHGVTDRGMAILAREPANLMQAWSFQVKRYCQAWLQRCVHTPAAQAVVLALVLGQKDTLSAEVRSAYARAGTLHVLAVSGLHVGILFWGVSLLLGLLKMNQRNGWLSPCIALIVLWFYAFVTGLSPSVLRATLMFTLMALAPLMGRQSSIYNTLAASAFLLLCWHPYWLFAVGFQLSYLAVLGIVYLQPRIYGLWAFRHWILDKLWLLSSVSLAAQLATTPVSLYYFHAFPTYFLVANWLVVPAALFVLCLGLLVVATSFWPGMSVLLAWCLEKVVLGVNAFVGGLQRLPCSSLGYIYLSAFTVLMLYSLLVLWLALWRTRQFRYCVAMSLVGLVLSMHFVRLYFTHQKQSEVIFYSIGRRRAVAFVKGRHSTLWTDRGLEATNRAYASHIQPSLGAMGVTVANHYAFEDAVQPLGFPMRYWRGLRIAVWQDKLFLFIDQGSLPLPHLTDKVYADFLVVEDNAVTSLQPLLDRFDCATLVIGASNSKQVAQQLQDAAAHYGLYSHSLRRQRALVVSW